MRFFSLFFVLLFAVCAVAQNGGALRSYPNSGVYAYNEVQGINAMSGIWTSLPADSASKPSMPNAKYRVVQFRNVSATLQRINYISLNTGDTVQVIVNAYSESGLRDATKKILSGMVADSTWLDIQYE